MQDKKLISKFADLFNLCDAEKLDKLLTIGALVAKKNKVKNQPVKSQQKQEPKPKTQKTKTISLPKLPQLEEIPIVGSLDQRTLRKRPRSRDESFSNNFCDY